jgi:hypothetical protein
MVRAAVAGARAHPAPVLDPPLCYAALYCVIAKVTWRLEGDDKIMMPRKPPEPVRWWSYACVDFH